MKLYKFLLPLLVLTFVSSHGFSQGVIKLTWKVVNYDIDATLPLNFESDRDLDVRAKTRIRNISSRSYSKATFRISSQAKVESVTVNGRTADYRESKEDIGGNEYLSRIAVSLPKSVNPNEEVEIQFVYKLHVETNSGLNSLARLNSQFLPMSFWYPTTTSWYYPGGADHAPVTLKVNNTGGRDLLSAGSEVNGQFVNKLNGQPFFVTGKWNETDADGIEIYSPRSNGEFQTARVSELASLVKKSKDYVEQISGQPISVPLRVVAVKRGAGFSDSGVIFVDDSVFSRSKLDSQTALNISQSVAKIWLGNEVDVSGSGFAVITEGLTRNIANNIVENEYGKDVADTERLRQRLNYSAIAQRDAPLTVTTPRDVYFYSSASNKGAMIWDFMERELGNQLYKFVQENSSDGSLNLGELRDSFISQKEYLDLMLDEATTLNLLVGLPNAVGGKTKAALRNLSGTSVNVDVVGRTSSGKTERVKVRIPGNGFAEAVFETAEKIKSVEVDPDKVFPQTNYADDLAPRSIEGNDPILLLKRDFDKRQYSEVEKNAKAVLKRFPELNEARILLARSQLAQNKLNEAKGSFELAMNSKLPLAQTLGWANLGLGDIAMKSNQRAQALEYYNKAINSDSEYGVTLLAREKRRELNPNRQIDPAIESFFTQFDSAINAKQGAVVEDLIVAGEMTRFGPSIVAGASEWGSKVVAVDSVDDENVWVETALRVKLLNKQPEGGIGVFRLSKIDGKWQLAGSEVFEVR